MDFLSLNKEFQLSYWTLVHGVMQKATLEVISS